MSGEIKGKEIKIYDVDIASGRANFEVGIRSSRNIDNLEMVLVGIEKLVESINFKADCREDRDMYRQALRRVLSVAVNHYGFQGGYYSVDPTIKIQYSDDDEGFVSDEDKFKALEILFKEL